VNWTTDCEHGRIIATAISSRDGNALRIDESEEHGGVEFGPEQLVARAPCEWADDLEGHLLACLPERLAASLLEATQLVIETGVDNRKF